MKLFPEPAGKEGWNMLYRLEQIPGLISTLTEMGELSCLALLVFHFYSLLRIKYIYCKCALLK